MSKYIKHRKFVHDVSNQLAIAEGSLKRIRKLKTKESTKEILQEIEENFDLSEKYMKDCISKLKEYRIFLHEEEAKEG